MRPVTVHQVFLPWQLRAQGTCEQYHESEGRKKLNILDCGLK